MTRSILACAAAVLLIGGTAVMAQSDPIAQRRTVMKGVGAATKTGTQMVKGEIAFDLAKAREVLQTFATAAETTHQYFPETSKTGGETTASPEIWKSQADFRAKFDAWGKDIEKAKGQVTNLDTFKAEFTAVTRSCNSCHQTYRLRTS